MPPVKLLPSARPHPFAGANTQAFMKILQTLGQFESIRQKRMLDSDILSVLERGGGIDEIAGVVQEHQTPTFSSGVKGLFQRIAAPFAQQPGRGITDMITAQALRPRAKTEIQKLTEEGYAPEEAKMIRDISHGLKPRASSRQQYENMTDTEKLDFLSKVKQRAEGQYYGIEGGNVQPRDPKLLDWALRELNKLPQYRQQEKTREKIPGFLGRKESEFPVGFPTKKKAGKKAPPTVEALFRQYGEIYDTLPADKKALLKRAWDEAAKDNVPAQEFIQNWRQRTGR